MNEDSILHKIRRWCEPTYLSSTVVGIGDDAAIIHNEFHQTIFCSDLMIENTHFDLRFSSAADVGHKALARSLSDIAAMRGTPLAVTISIAIPKDWAEDKTENFLEGFYQGATALALLTKTSIAGGDLSRLNGPLVIDVAAIGQIRADETLQAGTSSWLRSKANSGDLAYVTGSLGGAAYALRELQAGNKNRLSLNVVQRHLRPTPRFDIVSRLQGTPITCAMDISDGLLQDAQRLCVASGVSLVLDRNSIPVDIHIASTDGLELALSGGDDYELLLAVPESWSGSTTGRDALAQAGCHYVGRFTPYDPSFSSRVLIESQGRREALQPLGHDPFRDT